MYNSTGKRIKYGKAGLDYIYKEDDNETSATHIKKLNDEEIIREIANISSTDTSDKALAAAKELYKLAQSID